MQIFNTMKRKSFIFYFLLLSLSSCYNPYHQAKALWEFLSFCYNYNPYQAEFYYSFEDVVIKRIDDRNRTTLFYLENGVPVDTVWTTYSGFTNSWFNSELYFLEDKRVMVDTTWKRKRKKPNKFLIDRIDHPSYYKVYEEDNAVISTPEYDRLTASLKKDGRYYHIVLSNMENERDLFNKDNPTKVKVSKSLPETSD